MSAFSSSSTLDGSVALSLTSPLLVVAGLPFLRDGVLAVGRDACGTNDENDAEDRKRLLADGI